MVCHQNIVADLDGLVGSAIYGQLYGLTVWQLCGAGVSGGLGAIFVILGNNFRDMLCCIMKIQQIIELTHHAKAKEYG